MITAEIVADSSSPQGHRITTMKVTLPRIILAELNTHRAFSRNSASSRAIPFKKMVEMVQDTPFIPIAFQRDHKGMQGTEYFDDAFRFEHFSTFQSGFTELIKLDDAWLEARDHAVNEAQELNKAGVTKQLCNRLLEPFMYHTALITSTEWENFFALRCPQYNLGYLGTHRSWKDVTKAERTSYKEAKHTVYGEDVPLLERLEYNTGQAEIHIMALAEAMWDAMNESTPKELKAGEWHIPFGDNIDEVSLFKAAGLDKIIFSHEEAMQHAKCKVATARAARVSYTIVGEEDKAPDYSKDIQLHDRLLEAGHMSPFEHCARVMTTVEFESHVSGIAKDPNMNNGREDFDRDARGWSRNFRGFVQYRSLID